MYKKIFNFLLILNLFTFISCDRKPQKHVYEEILIAPVDSAGTQPFIPALQAQKSNITWTAPQDWSEEPGSGFRLASFKLANDPAAIDVSIVRLEGQAGGVQANIIRWMNQIKLSVLSDAALESFLAKQEQFQTKDGVKGMYVNFTELQESAASSTPSMIGAVIEREDATIFVKMAGSKENVLKQFKSFKSLTESLNFK